IDTSHSKSESQIVESKENSETSGFSISDIKADHVFNLLIIVIMFFTLLNGLWTRKIQKQMANIQETNVKVAVLPKIQESINVLDDIARVDLSNFKNQSQKNIENFQKLNQLILYFNESDGLDKFFDSIHDKVYEITGLIGNVSTIMQTPFQDSDNENIEKSRKEMAKQLKIMQEDIFKLRKNIIKRFRIKVD
ncbi:hypothetical protein KKF86_05125, partial [bacterium]|nr:hypothetical protein [bacterium]